MAGLDLNELLNRSIATSTQQTNENSYGLNVDLENIDGDQQQQQAKISNLNLDLESIAEEAKFNVEVNEALISNLRGALGAGVGAIAVLEARNAATQ